MLLGLVMLLASCAGTRRPPPPVRLTIDGPADGTTTLAGQVQVSGRVTPGASTVLVGGQSVSVSAGNFATQVAVKPGANVIDVLAGAARAHPAMSAIRIYRQIAVAVPNLAGKSASAATSALRQVGLSPQIQDTGGFFQSLLPLSKHVCATEPPAARRLAPGSTVVLQIAKIC